MALDDVCHVSRAAVADFQVVSVEDLVEFVQMHTGETLPVATCVCLRNSAFCPLVTFPS